MVLARTRRYFLFADWTFSEPDTAARQRASWPIWRRAVRPVGASLWWTGSIIGLVIQPSWRTMSAPYRVCAVASLVIIGGCVAFGAIDGFRQRRVDRLRADAQADRLQVHEP